MFFTSAAELRYFTIEDTIVLLHKRLDNDGTIAIIYMLPSYSCCWIVTCNYVEMIELVTDFLVDNQK